MFEKVEVPAGAASGEPVHARGMLWAEVDPGFFVGNDRRQFLGSISTLPSGGFSAFGARSEFIGEFDELEAAKEAVLRASLVRAAGAERGHRMLRRLRDLFNTK
ncbi:hypothetical protein ACI3KS_11130 [Microbacterium sp. ZW T5_45]|uniref:hypothetical protein n=1 Tax=Microbacterium sp. ZW T5_45 TaxID=3378080 RepID=UPI0038522045